MNAAVIAFVVHAVAIACFYFTGLALGMDRGTTLDYKFGGVLMFAVWEAAALWAVARLRQGKGRGAGLAVILVPLLGVPLALVLRIAISHVPIQRPPKPLIAGR